MHDSGKKTDKRIFHLVYETTSLRFWELDSCVVWYVTKLNFGNDKNGHEMSMNTWYYD